MIISLPALTVVLVVICESGRLYEDVIALMRGQVRIVVTQVGKQIVCSLESFWRVLFEQVLSDVCYIEVTIDRPCAHSQCKTKSENEHFTDLSHLKLFLFPNFKIDYKPY